MSPAQYLLAEDKDVCQLLRFKVVNGRGKHPRGNLRLPGTARFHAAKRHLSTRSFAQQRKDL
jgi:hypothetical protein